MGQISAGFALIYHHCQRRCAFDWSIMQQVKSQKWVLSGIILYHILFEKDKYWFRDFGCIDYFFRESVIALINLGILPSVFPRDSLLSHMLNKWLESLLFVLPFLSTSAVLAPLKWMWVFLLPLHEVLTSPLSTCTVQKGSLISAHKPLSNDKLLFS